MVTCRMCAYKGHEYDGRCNEWIKYGKPIKHYAEIIRNAFKHYRTISLMMFTAFVGGLSSAAYSNTLSLASISWMGTIIIIAFSLGIGLYLCIMLTMESIKEVPPFKSIAKKRRIRKDTVRIALELATTGK